MLIFFMLNYTQILSQNFNATIFSYGVKLGYQFGKEGGFVYGLEVSVTNYTKNGFGGLGGVIDIDFCKDKKMIHFGFEHSLLWVGYDIGPTFYFKDNKLFYGGTVNIFTGYLIYPFYGYSYFPAEQISIHQIGTYLKYFKLIDGSLPTFGG